MTQPLLPKDFGELVVYMDAGFRRLQEALEKIDDSLKDKVSKSELNAVKELSDERIAQVVKRVDGIGVIARWAVGIAIFEFLTIIGLVLNGNI